MVKKRLFDRGDIIRLRLNPVSGKETQGDFRPCIVLSPKAFNALGVSLVAPITQGGNFARYQGFAIPLIGMDTQGVILINGIRSIDPTARQASFIEKADDTIINECIAKLEAILNG